MAALTALFALLLGSAGCQPGSGVGRTAAVPTPAVSGPAAASTSGSASGSASEENPRATARTPAASPRTSVRTSPGATVPAAQGRVDPASGLRWVSLRDLPAEASGTMDVIRAGPPFSGRRDGVVFRNAERLLPSRASGYYHEFTVPTPGSSDRGARRIVTGGPRFGVANGEFYYTGDHYDSFERIRP